MKKSIQAATQCDGSNSFDADFPSDNENPFVADATSELVIVLVRKGQSYNNN